MNSTFGQPAFGQSTFGQPQFGSSANNAFAPGNNTGSTGSSPFGAPNFGSNSNSQQTPAFGQPSFGSNPGSTAAPLFGQPSFGSNTGSPFGQAGSNPSPFGQAASNNNSSPFGQQTGNAAISGTTQNNAATTSNPSPFGQTTNNAAKPSPFGQAGTTPSPFGQASTTTGASPFAQAGTNPSPFGQSATTGASPFAQAGTNPSPFGQAAKAETIEAKPSIFAQTKPAEAKPSIFSQNKEADAKPSIFAQTKPADAKPSIFSQNKEADPKPSIFAQTKPADAKPSIFSQTKPTDAKPSIFGQTKPTDAKPSIFGQTKPTDAKPSIFAQNKDTKTAETTPKPTLFTQPKDTKNTTSSSLSSAGSTTTEAKSILTSPKKPASRGLSGASPTKPKLAEPPVVPKLPKPEEPQKPQLTDKFLDTLKNLSIGEDMNEKVVIKQNQKESTSIENFKPVNFDVNRSLFANNIVDDAVQRILSKDENKEFLQQELNGFLFDHTGKKVMSKNFAHSNGNTVYFNANNEVLIVEKADIKKISVENSVKLEDFDNWQISYNGEDLVLLYYRDMNQSRFHIIDIKINKTTTLKTKFSSGVKKLSWHPLANNAVVTFMTNDNVLYQLNVWTGQLLHISKKILGFYDEQGKNSLRSVFDTLQAENDFDFSNITNFELSDDGWKLYLVDSVDSNVYTIYPFVPLSAKMITKKDLLEEMREDCQWLQTEYGIEHHVDEIVQKDLEEFLFDTKWIESGKSQDGEEMMSCEVPEDWYLNMGVQGPITFSNFPDQLYDHSLIDMKCISHKHEVIKQMMVLLYSNGQTVVVVNTNDAVIFRNNWKTLLLELPELQHFDLFENKLKYKIKEFLPSHIEEGCLAVTKNDDVVLLNFLDIFCRCESVFTHNDKQALLEGPCEDSLLLTLKKKYSEIMLLNNKDVLYFDESKNKLATLPYPSFKYVQGREYATDSNKQEFLTNMLTDVINDDRDKEEVKPLSNISTSCLNTYLSLLSQFQVEIEKLKKIDASNDLPLLIFAEDKPEELLSSMESIGDSMSKAISLSYSLQTWMRTCLAEYKTTLDDNLHNRLVDNKVIADLVNSIKEISDTYKNTFEGWEKRLTRLEAIKEKVEEVEKLTLQNEKVDASVLKKYRLSVESKIINASKMMEQMKAFEKDIKFSFMKLSNKDDPPKDEGLISKMNKIQIVDENNKPMNKKGKELLFSFGP